MAMVFNDNANNSLLAGFVQNGFSLIELMVVIALVAILSAIAIPGYTHYVVKAKLSSALPVLQAARDATLAKFAATGSFPTTTQISGGSITKSERIVINGTDTLLYDFNGTTAVWFCYSKAGLGLDGGIDPTIANNAVSSSGAKNTICMYSILTNDLFNHRCGNWDGADPGAVPSEYLPGGCDCKSVVTGVC